MRWFRRTPTALVLPENSRQIETPIEKSNEKIVSDLFPIHAITDSYPIVGTTTYGALTIGQDFKPDGNSVEFGDYILRKIERTPENLFARLYFTRGITLSNFDSPFRTESWMDDQFYWDPILFKVEFFADRTAPFATAGEGGNTVYVTRYFPIVSYIDGQRGGTTIREEHYVTDQDLMITSYETPMPVTVDYEFHNVRDSFGPCLHKKLIFSDAMAAFAAVDGAGDAVVLSSALPGRVHEATNFEEWESHVYSFKKVNDGLLKEYIRYTAIPPELPPISRRTS